MKYYVILFYKKAMLKGVLPPLAPKHNSLFPIRFGVGNSCLDRALQNALIQPTLRAAVQILQSRVRNNIYLSNNRAIDNGKSIVFLQSIPYSHLSITPTSSNSPGFFTAFFIMRLTSLVSR